jgi:hypothetical protein
MSGLGAEQEAYGWTWRFVQDPDGNNGWMPSNYLVQDDSAPSTRNNDRGLLPPSAPPTLILVPTMADPNSMPTPEPASSAPAVIEVVVTATPTATVRAPANAQPAGSIRLTPTPPASRSNGNAPANGPVPANPIIPSNGAANANPPAEVAAPASGPATPDPNIPPTIVPRVTGARLQATLAADPALRSGLR